MPTWLVGNPHHRHDCRAWSPPTGASTARLPPHQHLRWLRFERARKLLLQRDHRAVDVALAAGYSDQAHFVREFRRFAGVTPGRYR
ncbi:helix-turn-helix domain-containing protein [Rhodanobacter lindaniclasticus]